MPDLEQTVRSTRSWRAVLDVVATVAMLAAAGVVVWVTLVRSTPSGAVAGRPPVPVPAEPVSLAGSPVLGDPSAQVAIIEFSDFECPFCARFSQDTLPALRTKYIDTGKVQLVFRHLPLGMHQRAIPAAEAAECAHRQGRFWAVHDAFFASPGKLQDADIAAVAMKAGLDATRFGTCLQGEASARIQEDLALAKALQLTGTPAFLVGLVQPDGRVKVMSIVSGAKPAREFEAAIEAVRSEPNP